MLALRGNAGLGNGAVGSGRDPGRTLFPGGNITSAVAIFVDWKSSIHAFKVFHESTVFYRILKVMHVMAAKIRRLDEIPQRNNCRLDYVIRRNCLLVHLFGLFFFNILRPDMHHSASWTKHKWWHCYCGLFLAHVILDHTNDA